MKKILTLAAKKRESVGTLASRRLRRSGLVPAIVYGRKQDPAPVTVDHDELERAIRHHTRMLDLKVGRRKQRVLLSEVQYDSYGTDIVHVDFIRVAMDELVRVEVPLVLHGRAIGEQHGGVTEQLLTEVAVECLPGNIPEGITLVVTELEVGQSVHVGDLRAPEGAKITADPSHLVLTVVAPKKVEEAEAEEGVVEAEAEEPEVIAQGKEEGKGKGQPEEAK